MLWKSIKANIYKQGINLLKNYLFWIVVLTWILTLYFKSNSVVCNAVYSNTLYPILASILSSISNLLPFSLNDILFSVVWIASLTLLGLVLIRKIKFKQFVIIGFKIAAYNYILFYWLWGFNYFRSDVHVRMNFDKIQIEDSVFNQMYFQILNVAKETYCKYDDFNNRKIDNELEEAYHNMSDQLNIAFPNGKRRGKRMLFSRLIAGAGISGYFGPFLNEIHMNQLLMPVQYPIILAHEKAHQFGITSEAEASFYGWLVCNNCKSAEIRYSANLYLLRYFLMQVKDEKQRKTFISEIPEEILADLKSLKLFWNEMHIPAINTVQSKMYDLYLKGNNISDGIKNYGGVVKLVCEYEMKNETTL